MTKPLKLIATCLIAAPIGMSGYASAADVRAAGTLGVYLENDLFANTDQYYTSGFKLTWSSYDLERLSDSRYASPFLPVFDILPYINEISYQKNLVFALGQNIYTPADTDSYELMSNDRPYAGWLYLGVGVVWKDADVRNSLVFNIGVVGPWSQAQQSQRIIHDLRDFDHPNGWDHQIDNEIGLTFTYERVWRWPQHDRRSGIDWELLPHAGATVGNVSTFANAGAELRVGLNLPDDFGTSSIAPAATTSTPVDGIMGADRSSIDFGAYLFARIDGRAVARNIFLDGNTFSDSHSVNSLPCVADLSAGVAINYQNTRLAYALVYRTKEFKGQEEEQVFGTVSLNWTF